MKPLVENSVKGALLRYRVLAYIVGTGLAILVFVGIPLQVWAHSQVVVKIVGPIHGIFYIVYLVAAADLWVRARYNLARVILTILAGFVPIAAFVVERFTTSYVEKHCLAQ